MSGKGSAPRPGRTPARPTPRNHAARRQAALLRLSTGIAASHDEAQVYQSVVNGLQDEALGFNFLGAFILEASSGDRVLQASRGWKDVPEHWRVKRGTGLSQRAIDDGRLHYTPDVTHDAQYLPSLNTGSEVDVPLRVDDATIGVLVVESSEPNAFTADDFEVLQAAADQASIAIGRARLLRAERRRADEHKALLDTMADLSAELELPRVLQAVLARAVTLLDVTGGEVAIFDPETQELEVVASEHIGKDSIGTRLKLGEGAMGTVAETHQPLIIPSYREWAGHSAKYADILVHSVMAAPLLIGRRLVGAIATTHADPARIFTDEDLRLLNLFAPQAAIAIENARLYTVAQRQRQYFETLVHNNPVAIVTLDANHAIVACNPTFEKLFGYPETEAVGRQLDDLISTSDTHSEAVGYTREALDRPVRGIGRRRRSDGTLVDVEILGVPVIVDGERVGLMGLYHDITQLLSARREAEQANAAKSQFLASMSHELRTPLNAIIGYSEMLQEEMEELGQPQAVTDLDKIRASGRHLLALINDILDLSKIEAGKMDVHLEQFPVDAVVDEVLVTAQPLVARKGNRLEVRRRGEAGAMRSDRTKVRQILLNLLSNASKFTEAGTITFALDTEDGRVSVSIIDTGIGMTADQMNRLFEAFAQADTSIASRYGGTGLGLAISRRFARLLGGEIHVTSVPGQGSTFTVDFPRDAGATAT
ncbi:MAG TPA: GAF domain-containing protein [Gemmatimonadaceae bacterium]|nr:GAF domain-containing protein [Gemmatimonadaceae bacterium]